MPEHISVSQISNYIGQDIVLKGWVYNRTDKGKLSFLLVRDGTGFIQCVAFKGDLTPELFEQISHLPQESSVVITGAVREDKRAREVVIERPEAEAGLKVHSHWLRGRARGKPSPH